MTRRLVHNYNGYPKPRSFYAPGQRLLVNGCLVELLTIVNARVGANWGGSGCEVHTTWAAIAIDGSIVEVAEVTECITTGQGFMRDEKDLAFEQAEQERLKKKVFGVTVQRAVGFSAISGVYQVRTFTLWRHEVRIHNPEAVYRAQEKLLRKSWPTAGAPFVLPLVF